MVLPSIASRVALWAGIGDVMPRLKDDGFTGVLIWGGKHTKAWLGIFL
jgi:hypothetical protein